MYDKISNKIREDINYKILKRKKVDQENETEDNKFKRKQRNRNKE